ncbi:MAG: hypothetical protein V7749_10285 [Cocleimonas sp.]
MTLLNKLFLQKLALICTVLLISACGGGASTTISSSPSIADLTTLAENATAQPLVIAPTGLNSNQVVSAALGIPNAGLPGIADVYVGTLDLPYYFDTTNSLTSSWLPSLALRETITVPLMMTLPNVGTRPATGWPIVMYQHGITRNRTDVLLYADAQAAAGFAMIAIDLPTHGLVDTNNPFNATMTAFPTDIEQTFGANTTSGQNFINLRSLLTSRDNLRQGAANLLTLRKSLGGIINAATMMPESIDSSKVGLIAHSLGGMVAIPYLAVETTPTPSSLVMAGTTITDTLRNSASFSPVIEAGLAGLGVTSPAGIAGFYANAQELIDAGEPANYAAAAAANHPIHLIEVVGDGGAVNLPDQTVPNVATENLVTLMGASSVSTTTPGIAAGNPGIVRFTEGAHSSPLDPTASPAATVEIQTQLANFQGSAISASGPVIVISNGCVIEDGVCSMMPQ